MDTKEFNWEDYGIYSWGIDDGHTLPTNWQHVITVTDGGGGYEWATLHAFYSPTARRFFWLGDSGCSCNSWGDGVGSEADFHNGTKKDLERAVREFLSVHSHYGFSATDGIDALAELRRWKVRS